MLSPMPLAISLAWARRRFPSLCGHREYQRARDYARDQAQDKRDPKSWKGSSSPFRSTFRITTTCCVLSREHGSTPIATYSSGSCRLRKWWQSARRHIDGFLAPDNICQRAIYDGVGFLHILSKEIWTDIRAAHSQLEGIHHSGANSYAALIRAIVDATAFASKAENRKQSPRPSRRQPSSTSRSLSSSNR